MKSEPQSMEKYKLLFLEQAKDDLKEIALYIAETLQNPAAAERLIDRIIDAAEAATSFPYQNPPYAPVKPLKHEYRKALVDNYFVFYHVSEAQKLITVSRVIYARRNLPKILK